MLYLPHERLAVEWMPNDTGFNLTLPWLSMEIGVAESEKSWIKDAIENLHESSLNENTQRFIKDLKDYPLFYLKPRSIDDFKDQDLQSGSSLNVDMTTPQRFIETVGIPFDPMLEKDVPQQWTWNWEKIIEKARINGTDLYDPLSFVSYLICYRLNGRVPRGLGKMA